MQKNNELKTFFQEKQAQYYETKINASNVADIVDNQFKMSLMKELIDLTMQPKVLSRATEITPELEYFFERKRYRVYLLSNRGQPMRQWIKDYKPYQIYHRSKPLSTSAHMNNTGFWAKFHKETKRQRFIETLIIMMNSNVKKRRPIMNKLQLVRKLQDRRRFVRMNKLMRLTRVLQDKTNF